MCLIIETEHVVGQLFLHYSDSNYTFCFFAVKQITNPLIVVKPKVSTLFSLGIFIVVCLGLSAFTLYHMSASNNVEWYQYAVVLILTPIGLGLLFRQILGYKIINVGKAQIEIKYPTRFSKKVYKLKDIAGWRETKVKTATGTFKELEIRFTNKKQLNLSYQEHTDYFQVVKYLSKKCAKQRHDA